MTQPQAPQAIRPSPIAGQWYPGNPKRLAESVDEYIAKAALPELPGQVIAVLAPHAGHIYSGAVAGYAFSAVRGLACDLVAVISPMHQAYFEPLLTSSHQAYATPLGEVPIDVAAVNALDAALRPRLGYGLSRVQRDREHSLEIELPFLQRALSAPFKLLPVMVRDISPHAMRALGETLAQVLSACSRPLLVASSDLSHFFPQHIANTLDEEMLRRVEAFDPLAVLSAEEEGQGFACGRGAIAAVLWAAKALGANQVRVLHHATSGDVSGDFSQVVGYGAAVILKNSD